METEYTKMDQFKYSIEALAVIPLFYRGLNDINIFVEDQNKEFEYETIFKRMFVESKNILKIFTTGGKLGLIERFKEFGKYEDEKREVKNFYIADGDFDRIVNKNNMISDDHFIYLDAYNIENYFVDRKACHKFMKGVLKCIDAEVSARVDFNTWQSNIIRGSKDLFLLHCCVMKHHPTTPSVSRSSYSFIDRKTGQILVEKYEKYKLEIASVVDDLQNKIRIIETEWIELYGTDFTNIVCGKFLFDSLYVHLSSIKRLNTTKDYLRWFLVCNFDIDRLEYIKKKILT